MDKLQYLLSWIALLVHLHWSSWGKGFERLRCLSQWENSLWLKLERLSQLELDTSSFVVFSSSKNSIVSYEEENHRSKWNISPSNKGFPHGQISIIVCEALRNKMRDFLVSVHWLFSPYEIIFLSKPWISNDHSKTKMK
jgi:hypothetical protein